MRTVIDWGALGPDWRWREEWERHWGWRPPANVYYTTCPASVLALPIVNGIVRL